MKTFSRYFSWLIGTIDKSGIVIDRSSLMKIVREKRGGVIRAPGDGGFAKEGVPPAGLIFVDGAFLRFEEEVVVARDGFITHVSYSYHYQRPDGYYFRYDKLKEPFDDPIKNIREPQLHLHVSSDAPRFNTHTTNLSQILDIIKYNFYMK